MPAPTAPPQRISLAESMKVLVPGDEPVVAIAGQRGAALHVQEHGVEGITDLTGEQAERVDPGLVGQEGNAEQGRNGNARVAALETGPVALAFDAEHPGARLPAEADLTAGEATGCIMTALVTRPVATAKHAVVDPALVARCRRRRSSRHRSRSSRRLPRSSPAPCRRRRGGKIGGERGCNAQRDQPNDSRQNFLHQTLSGFFRFRWSPEASSMSVAIAHRSNFSCNIRARGGKNRLPKDTLAGEVERR